MENEQPCTHVFQRGPRRGEKCGDIVVRDDLCQMHLRLTEPDTELGTCQHKFLRGDRQGLYCPGVAVDDDGYCEMHTRIAEAGVDCCNHIFKSGYREGYHCTERPTDDGFCWKHSTAAKGLDEPRMVQFASDARDDEQERSTCHHKFVKGKREGKYCPRLSIDDTEFCRVHQPREKTARKPRVQRSRCTHILLAGPCKGKRCQKSETKDGNGFCRAHIKMANRCHHVIVIERRCKKTAEKDGYCTHHGDDNNAAAEDNQTRGKEEDVDSDPEWSRTESDTGEDE